VTVNTVTGSTGFERRWVAWIPWSITVALVAVSLLLPQDRAADDELVPAELLAMLLTIQALTFATVGLVISRARPRHAIGWLFNGVGIFVGLYLAAERYQHYALEIRPGELPFGELAAWLQAWLYVPALGIVVSVLPQLFPTGRTLSRRWSWGLVLAAAAFVGVCLSDALRPGIIDQTIVENPFGLQPDAYAVMSTAAGLLFLVSAIVAFASLVVRWRRADRRERQQLKLFAFAAALLPLFVAFSALANQVEVGGTTFKWISQVTAGAAFLGLPIATAVSILRHRLYDVDVVINRAVVYSLLTVVLVATYLVSVLFFRAALDPLTGESDLAVAASTLAVAAAFRPLRSRIQDVVDRRFYRSRYNTAQTLERFAVRLRHEVDLDTLGTDMLAVVRDTMQPGHVSLWLRPAKGVDRD
jgi:hypothetical protein